MFSAIDLFSGCGGTTLGLKEAGFRVLSAVEVDPLAAESYEVNHPEVMIHQIDIRDLVPSSIAEKHTLKKGDLDLLVGCPPCQGFSRLKRLNGGRIVRDKENKDLVFEFVRFTRQLLPKVLMLENVPRLLKDYRFLSFQKDIKRLGYDCRAKIVDASAFGVPQRRKRMIFVASRIGPIEIEGSDPDSETKTVREIIGSLPLAGSSGDPLHDVKERRSERIKSLINSIPIDGGSRTDLGKKNQLECHKRTDGFKDVYGRMSWDRVSPTITGGCVNPSKGRFLHPVENRTITLREAALLQSFPPRYIISLDRGKLAAAQLIGNAFPPRLVSFHAAQIKKHLEGKKGK